MNTSQTRVRFEMPGIFFFFKSIKITSTSKEDFGHFGHLNICAFSWKVLFPCEYS